MEHILYFSKKMHAYAGKILYLNLFGMLIISFLDGMGILLLVPLLSISGILELNAGMSSFARMFSFLQELPQWLGLLLILGGYILLSVGQTVLQRNLSLRDVKIHTGFINHIRLEIYRAILQSNWEFFIKKRKTDLINALTDELGRVTGGTYTFLQLLASLAFTLLQVGIAFWLSAEMTLFVLGCGLVIALFSRTFIRKSEKLGNQTSELARSYIGGITDHFNGIKEIKSNMLEESRISWMQAWCQRMGIERYEQSKIRMNSQLYYKISFSLIIAGFIYLSVTLFQTQGQQLLMIILIFSRLWPRFTGIQSSLEQIAAAIPAFKSLVKLQDECKEAKEMKASNLAYKHVSPILMEENLECKDMYYRYNREEPAYALEDINLQIRSKQMTAIIGQSGAGKSTLIDILMGLLEPENGQVLIDGVPLTSDNLLSLRKSISYVPQDPVLFNESIRENLMMIEPDATEEQLWEALHFAAAAEFVSRLPQGLDTLIGDRGVRLSGGERQRLVLARAILRKPSILVLDEATSALDTENETEIQKALDRLKGKITMIVIAHRLSTIKNADQVIVLERGKMIRKGGAEQIPGATVLAT
ncbi:ABC transporter ATP-binding protein [Paenibacillus eucommiae]|uniref:ATP-binding cassette subfamily C protein n=1 Tax=Paenibacillus eucommiae TaxID=1355755 RepID=A0ABS4IS57_9BACL|nr:ABC transporter ATP-binding protein [Paenibacillus eucommiae]MBP1990380.1 ATP-binding cassette subfamily C protein [Paenibacillus eucommiae]